jgi:hypothetical protein
MHNLLSIVPKLAQNRKAILLAYASIPVISCPINTIVVSDAVKNNGQ